MKPFDAQPHLVGDLLELRPLRESDFSALYAAASDPLIWAQHAVQTRYRKDVFRQFFDDQIASGGGLLALDRDTGEVIGTSRFFRYDPEASEVEIGFTFLIRRCWGGVYNGEMKALMVSHALQYVQNVLLLVRPENLRSQRAAEKIGGVRIGSRLDAYGCESIAFRVTSAEGSRLAPSRVT